MTGRERIRRVIEGEPVDRIPAGPLAVHFCAAEEGISLQEYSSNAQALADCVIAYGRKYEPDAVWISAGPPREERGIPMGGE